MGRPPGHSAHSDNLFGSFFGQVVLGIIHGVDPDVGPAIVRAQALGNPREYWPEEMLAADQQQWHVDTFGVPGIVGFIRWHGAVELKA
jgi:hypothetical protein